MNMHTIPAADRNVSIGDNCPPTLIDRARENWTRLAAWLREFPVITNHEEAKAGGAWLQTVTTSLEELDAERRSQVDPLNAEVKAINDRYRPVRDAFTTKDDRGLLDELKRRLTAFGRAEERRKAEEAERLRQEEEAAKQAAIEAEWAEEDARAEADLGICDVDVGSAIAEADSAFADFQRAGRAATRAEREIPTRIASTVGKRAVTMRTNTTLVLEDPVAAINSIGVTEKIRAAILSEARAYKRINGELPDGVSSVTERKI